MKTRINSAAQRPSRDQNLTRLVVSAIRTMTYGQGNSSNAKRKHTRPRKPALQNMRQLKRRSIGPFRNRGFSYQLFGMPPDCIAALVPRNFGGENEVAGSIGSCRLPNSFAPTRPIPEMAIAGRPAV